MRQRPLALVVIALCICGSRLAFADDGGGAAAVDAGDSDASTSAPSDDAGSENSPDAATSSGTPLGCNGALCDTSNDSSCAIAAGSAGRSGVDLGLLAVALSGVLAGVARRRARRTERPVHEN